jgi:hypothetical protein
MILAHSELGLEVLDPRGLWSLGFKTERWTSSFSRIFIIFSVEKKKKSTAMRTCLVPEPLWLLEHESLSRKHERRLALWPSWKDGWEVAYGRRSLAWPTDLVAIMKPSRAGQCSCISYEFAWRAQEQAPRRRAGRRRQPRRRRSSNRIRRRPRGTRGRSSRSRNSRRLGSGW